MTRSGWLTVAALALAGCGGGSVATATCDVVNAQYQGMTINECVEFRFSSSKSSDVSATCNVLGGHFGFDACARSGYLGICKNASVDGIDADIYIFPDSRTQTTNGAQAACDNLGGVFSPSLSGFMNQDAGSESSRVHCESSTSTCEDYTIATPSCSVPVLDGPCSSVDALGYCAFSNSTAGLRAWLYKSSGVTPAKAAEGCMTITSGVWHASM